MYIKQRLLRGGAPRAHDHLLVCGVEGEDDKGGDKGGGESDADKALKALTAKNAELLNEKKTITAKLRELEAAEADRVAKLAEAEEAAARQKGDWEKIENGYKEKLSAKDGEAYLWKSRYEGLVIDGGLEKALEGVKVNPLMREAVVAMVKAKHDVQLDEKGNATIDGKPLADFVGEWSKSDLGKAFILNGSSGGGSNGSGNGGNGDGAKNPFKAGSINLTEQGRLLRSDPARAKQLAAEAGVKL